MPSTLPSTRPIPTFVPLVHPHDELIWPAVEFEHGQKAAYGFTTRERCAEFIRRLKLDIENHRVTSLDHEYLVGWLGSCLEAGIDVLLIDEDPKEPVAWAAEITDVLDALGQIGDEDFGPGRSIVPCEQWILS
jgi:hypothetical protein